MTWRDRANTVLAGLFIVGKPAPSKKELFAAYPFNEREYTPYKVWLEQIKRWRVAHAAGRNLPADMGPSAAKKRKVERLADRDTNQGRLL